MGETVWGAAKKKASAKKRTTTSKTVKKKTAKKPAKKKKAPKKKITARKKMAAAAKTVPKASKVGQTLQWVKNHKWTCAKVLIISGAVGVGVVPYWMERAVKKQEQVVVELTESLLAEKMEVVSHEQFSSIAAYLRYQVDWVGLWYVISEADFTDPKIKELSQELPEGVLDDVRTWGAYYEDRPNVGVVDQLVTQSLISHWKKLKDFMGDELSQDVTVSDFIRYLKDEVKRYQLDSLD